MKLLSKRIISTVLAVAFAASATVTSYADNDNAVVLERAVSYTGLAVERFSDAENIRAGIKLSADKILLNGKAVEKEEFLFSVDDTLTLNVDVPSEGVWNLAFEYKPQEDKLSESLFEITFGESTFTGVLPILRRDKEQQYRLDRDGNELSANQVAVDEWVISLFDNYTDLNKNRLELELKGSENVITIKNNIQNISVKSIYLVKENEIPSYKEYKNSLKDDEFGERLIIEGERYAVTTASSIRGTSTNNPVLFPYETKNKRINTLSSAWSKSGQKAVWEFEVEKSGLYAVSFRYLQNAGTNMTVYRDMEIDGKVLFEEMNNISIPQTKSNTYSNFTLNVDGKPAYIWLEKGAHTVSLRATLGPMAEIYNGILELMSDVNAFGMSINKLASSSVDENRTWDTEAYFPTAVEDINGFADRAEELYNKIEKLGNEEPVYANDLLYAAELLRDIAKVPRTIPNKAEDISMGDSSVSKYLGTVISKMVNQSMALDRIYFGDAQEIPAAKANFFVRLWEGIKQFFLSFTNQYSKEKNDDELKVWMASSIPYVQVLQQLVDEEYNADRGTDIEISVMTGEQKLILANAAGTNPDVVLGVGYGTPFNLAIRGAAKNLLEYDDFLEFYDKQYNLEALVPMCYGEGIYGATDSQDFNILYYRKDILKTLGFDVPETWDDVKAMMPLLLRYNMNFYLPLSTSGAMKTMTVTSPFLYQNKAEFYSKDGLKVEFDSLNAVTAFEKMTEIYNIYSLERAVANFYNSFRYGEIPLGISGFGTYLQLELAAPELAGQWGTAIVPGELQEDGSVLRYQIADATASMILENTNKPDKAWDFLKWWLGSDTQYRFATLLQSTLGSEYRWNTANLDAFRQLPYPEEHKTVILKQWESQKELAPHAAAYMIQRETSNVWNNVVVNGKGLVESIDSAAILSNREIKRKMQEFGFCDAQGNPTKNYKVMTYVDLVKLLEERKASK